MPQQICVSYHGGADCEACCSPCASCSDPVAISTTPPHDEANCNSRAAAVCGGQITGDHGVDPWISHDNDRERKPIDNKAIDRVLMKRMQELANIKKK